MADACTTQILVIGANDEQSALVINQLRGAGHQVRKAASGLEGLHHSNQEDWDLIFLNATLPDSAAFDVCRQLKARPHSAQSPVLIISTMPLASQERVQFLDAGSDGILPLPVEAEELRAHVDALLRAKRAEDQLRKSDERLRIAQKYGGVGVWSWDVETHAIAVEPEFEELYGVKPGTIRSYEDWASRVHPEDLNQGTAEREQALIEHRSFRAEFRIFHASGEVRWLLSKGQGEYDASGRLLRVVGINIDITERKRDEDQLRRNHDTFYHLIQNNPFGIYVIDADFRLQQVSQGSQKVFGSIHPLLGRDFAEILRIIWQEPFASEAIARFRHTLETGESYYSPRTVEWRQNTEEMESYDWRIDRITLPDGRFGVVCYFYDLSERLEWEAALRESELFYRQTLESIPGMVFTNTANGKCDYVSQPWVDFTGIPATEQLNEGWVQMLHPDDRSRAFTAWRKAVEEHGEYDLEYRVRRWDGEYQWFKVYGKAIRDQAGEIVRWFGTALNIEGLKQVEAQLRESRERLQAALTGSGAGTFRWNIKTNELDLDENLSRLFGLPQVKGPRPLADFINIVHPEERIGVIERCEQCARHGVDFDMEYRVLWPDRSIHWIYDKGKTFFDSEGKPSYMAGACVDITERKRTELALAKAQAKLKRYTEQLERIVSERTAKLTETIHELEMLSHSIVHDMRAPLRAMNGYAQMVIEDHGKSLDPDAHEYLQRIVNAAARQDQFIQDVINYTRVFREVVVLKKINLDNLLNEILRQYPDLKDHSTYIQVRAPLGEVLGHDALLTQCLSNLLGNALKFVPKGQTPEVVVWTEEHEPGTIRLNIQDNGIGIAPEHQKQIFEMFQRLHTGKQYPGTGIGLAIVAKAVERMGGNVGVESQLGRGSRFWMELKSVGGSQKERV